MKERRKKFLRSALSPFFCFLDRGQSLVEIIIALGIGSLLVGGVAAVLTVTLRSNSVSSGLEVATALNESLLEKVRTVSDSRWSDIYNLNKGSGNPYFLLASGTEFAAVSGKSGVVQNDIAYGILGYWGFDETSVTTAYDFTGFSNGVLLNSPSRVPLCKVGACLDFSNTSSNYVNIPNNAAVDLNNASSVSVWIKPNWGSDKEPRLVIGKGGKVGSNYVFPWAIFFLDRPIVFINLNARPSDALDFPVTPTTNQWTHIVITYDRVKIKTYVNGALAESTDFTGAINGTTDTVGIGGISDFDIPNKYYFTGLIDDARIYNRVLSDDEVKALYQNASLNQYFFTENVFRDLSGNIVQTGGAEDPRTQKVTVVTEKQTPGVPSSFSVSAFLTRWKNEVFRQTDWSGGGGQNGPYTEPNNFYSNSSGVNIINGSIMINLP